MVVCILPTWSTLCYSWWTGGVSCWYVDCCGSVSCRLFFLLFLALMMNRITTTPSVLPLTKNIWWKNDIFKGRTGIAICAKKKSGASCSLTSRSSDVVASWFLPVEISYLEHVWSDRFGYPYPVMVCQGMCRMTGLARWPVEITSTSMINFLKFCFEKELCVLFVPNCVWCDSPRVVFFMCEKVIHFSFWLSWISVQVCVVCSMRKNGNSHLQHNDSVSYFLLVHFWCLDDVTNEGIAHVFCLKYSIFHLRWDYVDDLGVNI